MYMMFLFFFFFFYGVNFMIFVVPQAPPHPFVVCRDVHRWRASTAIHSRAPTESCVVHIDCFALLLCFISFFFSFSFSFFSVRVYVIVPDGFLFLFLHNRVGFAKYIQHAVPFLSPFLSFCLGDVYGRVMGDGPWKQSKKSIAASLFPRHWTRFFFVVLFSSCVQFSCAVLTIVS